MTSLGKFSVTAKWLPHNNPPLSALSIKGHLLTEANGTDVLLKILAGAKGPNSGASRIRLSLFCDGVWRVK
ncbi:hypothetical protein STW0522KLE44_23140 [Klebsiella sp. STW0522-44]|nr:hypothetical protein STW0522KLE44_23140 [Klebsiella sp. STW0522-44]